MGLAVHRVADHRVLAVVAGAEGARHYLAAVDPDTGVQRRELQRRIAPVEYVHCALHLRGAAQRAVQVIVAGRRGPEQRHDAVAGVLVDGALEAVHALGVPTTRALAAVSSGEPVHRERAEPGATEDDSTLYRMEIFGLDHPGIIHLSKSV